LPKKQLKEELNIINGMTVGKAWEVECIYYKLFRKMSAPLNNIPECEPFSCFLRFFVLLVLFCIIFFLDYFRVAFEV
jgi:hypothetical protein